MHFILRADLNLDQPLVATILSRAILAWDRCGNLIPALALTEWP